MVYAESSELLLENIFVCGLRNDKIRCFKSGTFENPESFPDSDR